MAITGINCSSIKCSLNGSNQAIKVKIKSINKNNTAEKIQNKSLIEGKETTSRKHDSNHFESLSNNKVITPIRPYKIDKILNFKEKKIILIIQWIPKWMK